MEWGERKTSKELKAQGWISVGTIVNRMCLVLLL